VAPPAPPDLRAASTRAPPDFAQAPPHIRRALQANVVVRCRGERGEQGLGSGVVVARAPGAYYALTNRHVVECGRGAGGLTAAHGGGADEAAAVAWSAPEAIDAVLLKVATATAPEPALLEAAAPPRVGDPVFAVGNPLGYEATFTAGVLSAMRAATYGPHRLQVLQVQASINPGNSGGGLYDATGHLVGLATWSTDKGTAEGLGFAVSTVDLLALLREGASPELRAALGAATPGGTAR
jgi:serine protease Do